MVEPNKADDIDAHDLLRKAATKRAYDKVADSDKIMRAERVQQLGANSRSFRRLLRCVGHPRYLDQSRNPAA